MKDIIVFDRIKFVADNNGVYSNLSYGKLEDYKNTPQKIFKPIEHVKQNIIVFDGIKFKMNKDDVYSNESYGLLEDYQQIAKPTKESQHAQVITTILPEDVLPLTDEEMPAIIEASIKAVDKESTVKKDFIDDIDMAHPAPIKKKGMSQFTKDKISKAMKAKKKAKKDAEEALLPKEDIIMEVEVMDIAIDEEAI